MESIPEVDAPTTPRFHCEHCNYSVNKHSSFVKHMATTKHERNIRPPAPTLCNICNICNKSYKSRTGLWFHKKKCIPPPPPPQNNNIQIEIQNKCLEIIILQNNEIKDLLNRNHKILLDNMEIIQHNGRLLSLL
jgi:hypothetical protein